MTRRHVLEQDRRYCYECGWWLGTYVGVGRFMPRRPFALDTHTGRWYCERHSGTLPVHGSGG